MNFHRFKNKNVVVTGSSSGIGRGLALAYANEGANVVVNYCHSKDKAEEVVNSIKLNGGNAIAIQADVSNSNHIQNLITEIQKVFGTIDVWVNNAGADILTGSAVNLSLSEKLERLIEVDLKGTMNCSWAIAPIMQEQGYGVILNNSWDLAIHGFQGSNPQIFAATKAGILGFSRSLAKSVGPNVRVNIMAPGWIATEFIENDMADDYYQARIKEIPLGRFGKPEDVAGVALYLTSDDAAYITGEVININGGLV